MHLPIEIVSEIVSHFLQQIESDIDVLLQSMRRFSCSSLNQDLNSLGSVSMLFRTMVMKVKYRRVEISTGISFCIGNYAYMYGNHRLIKVSFEKFNEYIQFVRSNGLSFNITKSLKVLDTALSYTALNALLQLSDQSQFELYQFHCLQKETDDQTVTFEVRENISYLIKSLQTVHLYCDEDNAFSDQLEFYPSSYNIDEICLTTRHVEFSGVEEINAHKSIKHMILVKDKYTDYVSLEGLELELQHLTIEQFPAISLHNFNSCINSLTNLSIVVNEAYSDFLLHISKFINLKLLKVTVCREATADFYPSLIRIVCLKLTNIQTLLLDNNHGRIFLMRFLIEAELKWRFENQRLLSFELKLSEHERVRYLAFDGMLFLRFFINAIEHFVKGNKQSLFVRTFGDNVVPFTISDMTRRGSDMYEDITYDIDERYCCSYKID